MPSTGFIKPISVTTTGTVENEDALLGIGDAKLTGNSTITATYPSFAIPTNSTITSVTIKTRVTPISVSAISVFQARINVGPNIGGVGGGITLFDNSTPVQTLFVSPSVSADQATPLEQSISIEHTYNSSNSIVNTVDPANNFIQQLIGALSTLEVSFSLIDLSPSVADIMQINCGTESPTISIEYSPPPKNKVKLTGTGNIISGRNASPALATLQVGVNSVPPNPFPLVDDNTGYGVFENPASDGTQLGGSISLSLIDLIPGPAVDGVLPSVSTIGIDINTITSIKATVVYDFETSVGPLNSFKMGFGQIETQLPGTIIAAESIFVNPSEGPLVATVTLDENNGLSDYLATIGNMALARLLINYTDDNPDNTLKIFGQSFNDPSGTTGVSQVSPFIEITTGESPKAKLQSTIGTPTIVDNSNNLNFFQEASPGHTGGGTPTLSQQMATALLPEVYGGTNGFFNFQNNSEDDVASYISLKGGLNGITIPDNAENITIGLRYRATRENVASNLLGNPRFTFRFFTPSNGSFNVFSPNLTLNASATNQEGITSPSITPALLNDPDLEFQIHYSNTYTDDNGNTAGINEINGPYLRIFGFNSISDDPRIQVSYEISNIIHSKIKII